MRTPIAGAVALALVAITGSSRAGTVTTRAIAVSAGVAHTCALTSAGGVKCWGYNGHDELGKAGTDLPYGWTPGYVPGLTGGVAAISAGLRHTCALTRTGGVKCWGAIYSGALGDGRTDRHFTPSNVFGLNSGVLAVAAGYDNSCALTSGGGVKCWGSNQVGQLGDGTTDDRWTPVDVSGLGSGVTAIAVGGVISCAVTSTGGVKCWGAHYGSTPSDVTGLSAGVTAITAGGPLCALTSGGGITCWGGDYGWIPVEIPGLRTGVAAISANGGHACALMNTGGAKCWGENGDGQLGDGTRTDRATPVDVVGLRRGVTAIAAGFFYTCAVVHGGGIKCWGQDPAGQVGDRKTHIRLTPAGVVGFGPRAVLAISSQSVSVTRAGIAPVRLRCGAAAPCKGALTLVRLGRRSFSIPARQTRTVPVRLPSRGFRQLVELGRLVARARVRYEQPAGGATTVTRKITLRSPR